MGGPLSAWMGQSWMAQAALLWNSTLPAVECANIPVIRTEILPSSAFIVQGVTQT